jgi:hypothetical protein
MADFSGFEDRRLSICLAGVPGLQEPCRDVEENRSVLLCGAAESRASLWSRHGPNPVGKWNIMYKDYVRQTQDIMLPVNPRAVFAVYAGDNRARMGRPTIVKTRMIADRDAGGVLLPLDRIRHWKDLAVVDDLDIPFREKANRLVWRGATTGAFRAAGPGEPASSRYHIATLDLTNPALDLGYSEIVQVTEASTDLPLDLIRSRLRPALTLQQQLQARFLLSLEGNDVATGLKWMLHSNSTVLMPVPTCETWACEGELVPFEHFVPVKRDLSDLNQVFDWCLANLDRCEDIALNGKRFMAQFRNEAREKRLAQAVARAYLEKTDYDLTFGQIERGRQFVTRSWQSVRALAGA